MPRTSVLARSLVIVATLTACAGESSTPVTASAGLVIDSLPSPAGPDAGEPNLAVDSAGRVYLTWIERNADSSHAVKLAVREGDAWSAPRTIVEREPFFVNWADFPSLAVSPGGRLVVHWLQRSGPATYSYDVRVAQSADGGATWSPSMVLHRDGLEAEHGFVSMWPVAGDSIAAVWLDGRKSAMPDSAREMQLAFTTLAADGSRGVERMLDARICDCCQTAVAVGSRGPIVAYRDRSASEVRDIYVTRLVDGVWTAPAPVHADNWEINACPVNGPSVAASGDRVVVAWFTGARDSARVKAAFSSDGGATFGAPVVIDDGNPAGRVDVELVGGDRAVVTWIERTGGDTAEVRVREVRADGTRGEALRVATTSGKRASGFPRMIRARDELVFAWTVPGTPAVVRVARARIPEGS